MTSGPMLKLLMSCDGGDVDKVKIVDTGFADFLAITERDIDFAWIFYGWDGINAQLKGIDLNVVMLNKWQDCVPDYYTPLIITNEKLIQEQPDIVKAFVSATAKGYEFAIKNPDEAAEILLALDRLGADAYVASDDELNAIDEALAQIEAGEYATDAETEAAYSRFRK